RPQEEPTPGFGPGDAPVEFPAQSLFENRALGLVCRSKQRQSALEHTLPPDFVDEPLVDRTGTEVRGLFGDLEPRDQRRGGGDPCDAESGRDGLRKTAQVDDAALAIVSLDWSRV